MCGSGVMSSMDLTLRPAASSEVIALSRPLPGPLTRMSIERRPCSRALVAAVVAACCAAKGVPLREPLKPSVPALDHERVDAGVRRRDVIDVRFERVGQLR